MPILLSGRNSGEVIEKLESKYSGTLYVIKSKDGKKVLAGNLIQSGNPIKKLWQKPLKTVKSLSVTSALVLGLGAGSAVETLQEYWPKADVTGVEIDKKMIEIGKKHFSLCRIPNLRLITADAFSWVHSSSQMFNLVLVDIFSGSKVSDTLYQSRFFRAIANRVKPSGAVIINQLFYDEYVAKAEKCITAAEEFFDTITLVRNNSNLFIIAR